MRRAIRCGVACCALILLGGASQGADPEKPKFRDDRNVRIVEQRVGRSIKVFAHLTNCTEETITLTLHLTNMTASAKSPLTVDASGRSRFELVTVQPEAGAKRWNYRFSYVWRPGRRGDSVCDPFDYALPYVDGPYKVLQGPLGEFSHHEGSGDENAIDWSMPVGTKVCAARAGVVVGLRQDSETGGTDPRYKLSDNYVIIEHGDATFAEYRHLKKDSLAVKLGQQVAKHDVLGLSGETGYTSRPHLHFAVFRNIDGKTRKTFPLKFITKSGQVESLREGNRY